MATIRKSAERGGGDHGWLKTKHTFSFGDYQDPRHMRFRSLRVMNEDWVAPGAGFPMHGHRDMEILTYVLEGALEHQDSLGHGETLRPGEFQRMTAGRGIRHGEFNPSEGESTHLYQIWLLPERPGLDPSYEQRPIDAERMTGRLGLVASRDGREGSLVVHQDADVYVARMPAGLTLKHDVQEGRGVWLQVLRGSVKLDGQALSAGDGAAFEGEPAVEFTADGEAEVMLFDLA